MISKIKSALLLVAVMCLMSMSVYGATVDYDRASGEVLVKGENVEQGKLVRLIVLKPDADYEKLISGEKTFLESCIHIAELKQNAEDGEYAFDKFVIKEGADAGEYTVVLIEDKNVEELTIDYASILQTLGFITSSQDADEVKLYVDKYNDEVYKLPIEEGSEFHKLDTDGRTYVLEGLIGTNYADCDNLLQAFNTKVSEYLTLYKATAFRAVSNLQTAEEVKSAINTYEVIYGIDRNEELFSALNEEEKAKVYAKMTAEEYTNETQIQLAFKQKTVLYYIEKGPWGKIPELIEGYNNILQLNLAKYNNNNSGLLKYILGKECKNVTDLQILIDNYKEPASSNGGGGGGSSGIKDLGYSAPLAELPNFTEEINTTIFDDVSKNYWAYDAINYLYKNGIVSGKADRKFAPNDYVTRAETAKIITDAIVIENSYEKAVEFNDVPVDFWAYKYVKKASELGFVKGYDDGSFGPNNCITRQDLCVMLYGAMKKAGYEFSNENISFSDADQIGNYAYEAVCALSSKKIISGMDDGTFCPHQYATRAQIAMMIYSVIK